MDGYYDPWPLLTLKRPVVIGSVLGIGSASVAKALCGMTALPLVDVDRQLEHDLGRLLSRSVVLEGEGVVSRRSMAVVSRALGLKPPPVIALGMLGVQDKRVQERIRSEAMGFYLRFSAEAAMAWLTDRAISGEGGYSHLFPEGVSLERVQEAIEVGERAWLGGMHQVIRVEQVSVYQLAQQVLLRLE